MDIEERSTKSTVTKADDGSNRVEQNIPSSSLKEKILRLLRIRRKQDSTQTLQEIAQFPHEPERPIMTYDLKGYLLEASNGREKSISDMPKKFDLGSIGREAEKALTLSLIDIEKVEYGSRVFINSDGRLVIPNKPDRGDIDSVQFGEDPPRMRRIFGVHTHGIKSSPPSPEDVTLLSKEDDANQIGELIITPQLKILLMRTKESTDFHYFEIGINILGVLDREGSSIQNELLKRASSPNYDPKNPTNEDQELDDKSVSEYMYALARVLDKHKLVLYTCPIQENVASKIS